MQNITGGFKVLSQRLRTLRSDAFYQKFRKNVYINKPIINPDRLNKKKRGPALEKCKFLLN